MRLRFRKRPQPSQTVKRKSLYLPPPLPPTDNPDPAFSPDPQAHPYHYFTGQEWVKLPLAPGHPTLQPRQRRRPRKLRLAPNNNNRDSATDSEFELIQPPNSPVSDNVSSDCNNYPLPQAPALAQRGTTPVRVPAVPPPPPSMSFPQPSQAKEASQPVKRFGFLTKRVFAKQDSTGFQAGEGKTVLIKSSRRSEESGPSIARQADKSALQRHKSAPGPPRSTKDAVERQGRPVEASRAVDISATEAYAKGAVRSVPSTINQDTGTEPRSQGSAPKRKDLDKIDELDETFLYDARLHHDGPYEVALRAGGFTSKSRMPLGLSDNGRLHQFHDRTMKAVGHVYMPPEVPPGVPLNLSPGQLLPRNFRRQAGKPPRLRNNLVAPLPQEHIPEETVSLSGHQEVVVAPRHANYNAIPFHRGGAPKKAKQARQNFENPLDGPPIDPSFAIGLAMMQFEASGDDDKSINTPLPVEESGLGGLEDMSAEEYDPYAPENLEEPTSAKRFSYTQSEPVMHTMVTVGSLNRRQNTVELTIPSELYPNSTGLDSPSASSHLDLQTPSDLNGASEETLVQEEDDPHCPDPDAVQPPQEASAAKLREILLEKIGQGNGNPNPSEPDMQITASPIDSSFPPPSSAPVPSMTMQPVEAQSATTPSSTVAARYDKQLPPHPPSTPPPSDDRNLYQGANVEEQIDRLITPLQQTAPAPTTEDAQRPVKEGREWKNSGLLKALQRNEAAQAAPRTSTSSQQSHTSTRANDGHTPAVNTIPVASPSKSAPPPMMSRTRSSEKASSAFANPSSVPRISRRDPIFSTDSLTRYPKPSPLSGPPTTASIPPDRKPYLIPSPRPIQRRNSTSSKHSSTLHTIHEDDDQLPAKKSSERLRDLPQGQPISRSQSQRQDPRTPGLQRSQSSVSPRTMPHPQSVQVGQVYPRHLQNQPPGFPIQRPVSQLLPRDMAQMQPPPYTENPPPRRPSSKPSSNASSSSSSSSSHRRREERRTGDLSQELQYQNGAPAPQMYPEQGPPSKSRSSPSHRHREPRSAEGDRSQDLQHQQQPPMPVYPDQGHDQGLQNIPKESRDPSKSSTRDAPELYPQLQSRPPLAPTPRMISDDRRAQRAVNTLSGVPEMGVHHSQPRPSQGFEPTLEQPTRDLQQQKQYTPQQQQYPIQDNPNSKASRSISPSIMSSTTGMPRFAHNHMPKKLVMPTPLLGQPNLHAQSFNEIFDPRPAPTKRYTSRPIAAMPPPGSRPRDSPSPPNFAPARIGLRDPRLDPAFSAGRKLKKRTSYVPPPPPPNGVSHNAALTFDPLVTRLTPPAINEKPSSKIKVGPEKVAKRGVLSKRRTNL
ncbi:hypothetical protein D9611_005732 [Ephemerocybe angulata]|uniref:Uncharacterized protein n=1 Tax=Ephemerocybe angulata TaxID=980116 RepID=A0A8H5F4J2_9AGAR|nr:hypothetical protein D9611_005732 [Tulosesus angulatus]